MGCRLVKSREQANYRKKPIDPYKRCYKLLDHSEKFCRGDWKAIHSPGTAEATEFVIGQQCLSAASTLCHLLGWPSVLSSRHLVLDFHVSSVGDLLADWNMPQSSVLLEFSSAEDALDLLNCSSPREAAQFFSNLYGLVPIDYPW